MSTLSRRAALKLGAALPFLVGAATAQSAPPAPVPNPLEPLWSLTLDLRRRLEARFPLLPDAGVKVLETFSSADGRAGGNLYALAGRPLARVVHTRLNAGPFSTMRLTAWCDSSVEMPHLVMEFGALPQLFVYLDYAPRSDLMLDLAALERYYTAPNADVLRFLTDKRFTPYVSPSPYVRQFQSGAALCFTAQATPDVLETVSKQAQAHFERWLGWLEAATPTPGHKRAALAARDRSLMKESAERDPGNALAGRLFGPELAGKLVRALWTGA